MRQTLTEKLNEIDRKCLDEGREFKDLKTLYEWSVPKLSQKDKDEIKKVVQATNDPNTIAAVIQSKALDQREDLDISSGTNMDVDIISYNDYLSNSFDGYTGDGIDNEIKLLNKVARSLHTSSNKLVAIQLHGDDIYEYGADAINAQYVSNVGNQESARLYSIDNLNFVEDIVNGYNSTLWFKNTEDAQKYINMCNQYLSESLDEDKKYKLRIYKLSGKDKGNLDKEEFFSSKKQLISRYKELFDHDLFGLNPTGWEKDQNGDWKKIKDSLLQIKNESLNDDRSPADIANDICKYIDNHDYHGMYDLVDYADYPMNTVRVDFIVDGDWRHEHKFFDSLIYDWAEENGCEIFKIDEEEIGNSLSDSYEAYHEVYISPDADTSSTLNSMRGLFEGTNHLTKYKNEAYINADKDVLNIIRSDKEYNSNAHVKSHIPDFSAIPNGTVITLKSLNKYHPEVQATIEKISDNNWKYVYSYGDGSWDRYLDNYSVMREIKDVDNGVYESLNKNTKYVMVVDGQVVAEFSSLASMNAYRNRAARNPNALIGKFMKVSDYDNSSWDDNIVMHEDTEKNSKGKWVNRGKEGTHGKFATKKAADAQRKAMFANGYHEGLQGALSSGYYNNIDKELISGADNLDRNNLITDNNVKCSTSAINNLIYILKSGKPCQLCLGGFEIKPGDKPSAIMHAWLVTEDGKIIQTKVPASYRSLKALKCIRFFPKDLENLKDKLQKELYESLNESKQPKYWNTIFAANVIDAYNQGKLTKNNIKEWETEYNGGITPKTSLGTKSILDYYISTNSDPRDDLNEDYTYIKNDWGDPYSYQEVEKDLEKLTNGYKEESGSIRTYYEQEKNYGKQILKKHYRVVEVSDGRTGYGQDMSWVISYAEPTL